MTTWYPYLQHAAINKNNDLVPEGDGLLFSVETGVQLEVRERLDPPAPGTGRVLDVVQVRNGSPLEFETTERWAYWQSGTAPRVLMYSLDGLLEHAAAAGALTVAWEQIPQKPEETNLDPAAGTGVDDIVAEETSSTTYRFRVPDRLKQAFLDLRFVLASGRSVDATNAPGVDPTGAVECSAAIQAVLDANAKTSDAFARKVRLQGTFNIANTLVVKGHVDFSAANFRYSGSGTAIRVGDLSVGQFRRARLAFNEIICTSKPTTPGEWLDSTVGLELRNVSVAKLELTRIFNFATGLALIGDGTYGVGHTAYNKIHLGHLDNNRTNETLQCEDGEVAYPFVNQNVHYGGTMSHSEGTGPGIRHVVIGSDADNYGLNANVWDKTSLEGGREQWTIECHGSENKWDTCRYEFVPPGETATGAPVYFGPKAARNIIDGGYMVDNLAVAEGDPVVGDPLRESGPLSNQIFGNRHIEYETVGTIGLGLSAGGGNSSPVLSVLPAKWRRLGLDPATKYLVRILGSGKVQQKLKDDVAPRIEWDPVTNSLILGGGYDTTSKRSISWAYHNAGVTAVGPLTGSIRLNLHPTHPFGAWIKTGLSTSSWQVLGCPVVTTAQRADGQIASAANAGVGAECLDSDLGLKLWSDGADWRRYSDNTVVA